MIPIIFATAATFTTVKNELLPLVLVALLLDGVLLSVWYILGALLNNSGVKESAKGEFYQLAGTAILAVIIVGTVGIFANLFSSSLSGTIMSSSNINTLCNNIEHKTQLDIINGGTFSFLGGTSGAGGLFPGLCSYVSTSGGNPYRQIRLSVGSIGRNNCKSYKPDSKQPKLFLHNRYVFRVFKRAFAYGGVLPAAAESRSYRAMCNTARRINNSRRSFNA